MSDLEDDMTKIKVKSTTGGATSLAADIEYIDGDYDSSTAGTYRDEHTDGNPHSSDPNLVGLATNDLRLDLDLDQVNDNIHDYDDNLSLEVNFGDGSSCRASDVSSLSFQNMVLDDPDGDNLDSETVEVAGSRRDSADSSDSIPNDFSCDAQGFSGDLEAELNKKVSLRENDPDRTLSADEERDAEDEYETGTMKRKNKMSVALDKNSTDEDELKPNGTQKLCSDGQNCSDSEESSHRMSVTEHAPSPSEVAVAMVRRDFDASDDVGHLGYSDIVNSISGTSSMEHNIVMKRNSLEIRNNIPNVNEIKSYDDDVGYQDLSRFQSQGAVPKMKKKSPGLARRLAEPLGDSRDRDTSSSEKEFDVPLDNSVISAQKMFEAKLRNGNISTLSALSKSMSPKSMSSEQDLERDFDHALREGSPTGDLKLGTQKNIDIENEYDYVKYARIQQGDSYVGMRLAYSSSNDSLNFNKRQGGISGFRSDEDHYLGSSRETSPEKILQPPHANSYNEQQMRMSKVNEDTLTEIPLNGSDHLQNDEQKNFSLSPEATECDSAEVESVISEEGKSSTSGMPMVEDGLSSSQGSDTEDTSTMDTHRPAEILKRRYKAEIGHEISMRGIQDDFDGRSISSATSSHQSTMSGADSDRAKDSVELAIKDIKTAIERSKNMQLKSPHRDDPNAEQEPVWVMRATIVHGPSGGPTYLPQMDPQQSRDSYVRKLQRQEEMRRVREEIERQQEEEYVLKETDQEQEQVFKLDKEEDELMRNQFTRNDGKPMPPGTKGYDTDDEYEEHDRHLNTQTRWVRGRSYGAVPADVREEDPSKFSNIRNANTIKSNTSDFKGIMYNRYTSKSETNLNTDTPENTDMRSSTSALAQYEQSVSQTESTLSNLPTRMATASQVSNSQYHASAHSRQSLTDLQEEDYIDENPPKPMSYVRRPAEGDYDTDEETDELLDKQYHRNEKVDIPELSKPPVNRSAQAEKRRSRARQVTLRDPNNETVLIEGVLFRARYLGSTQLISEGQPSKGMRMMQAQEAVGRIKAPEGESQPSTEVDLFVSTEKIMVLNTDLQEIMMDHSLRTISYIADIGDIVVIMARRRPSLNPLDDALRKKRQSKILCHVFESEEAQLIAQSIGQAFQVAYMEFLKANGIDDPGLIKEMDYQEVLNQQEIFGEELFLFSNKDMQKEVIVPKLKGEPLGVVIVESGWGSMVPTVVLANMAANGAAARCGQLNIGDQIMSINGISLVGLPLSACQNYIKVAKNQTVIKLTVVSCAPVVEVLIKRPDVKYQLGFSVQNGVICSLLRGGIAERGGVRVGHRIIEINGSSVVAVPHEKIVNMLAASVGEIHMKTMPTSIFRLLTGQETPHYI